MEKRHSETPEAGGQADDLAMIIRSLQGLLPFRASVEKVREERRARQEQHGWNDFIKSSRTRPR